MSTGIFAFQGRVHEAGYEWKEGERLETADAARNEGQDWNPTLLLYPCTLEGKPSWKEYERLYQPLEDTALFRNFADIPPSEAGILQFANRYGVLGLPKKYSRRRSETSGEENLGYGRESIDEWIREVYIMRCMVSIIDRSNEVISNSTLSYEEIAKLIQEHSAHLKTSSDLSNEMNLEEYFYSFLFFANQNQILHETLSIDTHMALPDLSEDTGAHKTPIEVSAMYCLQYMVNEKLAKHAHMRLVWNKSESNLQFRLVPRSLLGLMWLQFANSVEGNR